jgi:hypothetical protein
LKSESKAVYWTWKGHDFDDLFEKIQRYEENIEKRGHKIAGDILLWARQYEQMGDWYCQGTGRDKSIRPLDNLPSLK